MKALRYGVLVVLTALFISPLLFVVLTSFKTARQAVQTPPKWIPDPFTSQAYERILRRDQQGFMVANVVAEVHQLTAEGGDLVIALAEDDPLVILRAAILRLFPADMHRPL